MSELEAHLLVRNFSMQFVQVGISFPCCKTINAPIRCVHISTEWAQPPASLITSDKIKVGSRMSLKAKITRRTIAVCSSGSSEWEHRHHFVSLDRSLSPQTGTCGVFRFPLKPERLSLSGQVHFHSGWECDMKRINESVLLMKWNMLAVHDDVSHLFIQQTFLPKEE